MLLLGVLASEQAGFFPVIANRVCPRLLWSDTFVLHPRKGGVLLMWWV